MSRIALIFTFLLSALTSIAGSNDIAIKGTITNPLADEVKFNYLTYDGNWLNFKENSVSEELDAKGNFLVQLPLSHKHTLIVIRNGNEATEIYASPGDKIKMTVDAKNFDASLKYEGVGMKADIANFMAKHVLKFGITRGYYPKSKESQGKEQDEFMADMDAMMQEELDFLIMNGMNLPQSFVEFWNAHYEYLKYETMLSYPHMHEIIKNKSYDISNIPQENYQVVKRVPEKFDDKYIYIYSYRKYIDHYYSRQLAADGVEGEGPYFAGAKKLELAHKNMPKQSEEYVFANHIFRGIKYKPMTRTEELYDVFSGRYHNSEYADFLVEEINKKKRLAPGSPVIDFAVIGEDGKKIKVSDLKGKVVYIDFWASWCGPCKAQFPYTKDLKKHFKGKDVVFVYVSIDKDEKAWQKAIKKYDLDGYHTRVDGEKSEVIKAYGVRGVPSYYLVDKEGKFVTENTPRPSQQAELIDTIEALL